MWDSLLGKILEKIFAKVTSVEDLIFLLIFFSAGIWISRYWMKYQKLQQELQKKLGGPKDSKPEAIREIETYSKAPHSCHNFENLLKENNEIKMRLSKVMNVLSKEFDQTWDRYLYDANRDPDEDDV